jgi:hypothetical protein
MNGVHGGSLFSGLRRPACGRRRRWRMHYHDHRLDQLPTHQPSAHPHPQQEANVARDLESAGGEVRVIAARPDRGRLGQRYAVYGNEPTPFKTELGRRLSAWEDESRKLIRNPQSPCNSPGSPHKRSTDEHHHSPAGHRPESNLAEVQARIGHSTTTWRCAPTRPCRTRAHLAARKPAFATESVASSRWYDTTSGRHRSRCGRDHRASAQFSARKPSPSCLSRAAHDDPDIRDRYGCAPSPVSAR